MMQLALIVAMGKNRVIGHQNRLPWHLPADLQHFKKITMGKPIVMGRKTYESIGRPLPGRKNIIVTRDPAFQAPGCIVVHSLKSAIEAAGECEEAVVIGGAGLYREALPLASRIYLTQIDADFQGDRFFPEFDRAQWEVVEQQHFQADEKNPFDYQFVVLERKNRKLSDERNV